MVRKEELWKQIEQLQQEKEILRLEATNAQLKAEAKVYRDLYENLLYRGEGHVGFYVDGGMKHNELLGGLVMPNSERLTNRCD